jgi:hypothetical protein
MLTDHYAHKYFDDPKSANDIVDDDFDQDAELERWAAEDEENIDDVDDFEDVPE